MLRHRERMEENGIAPLTWEDKRSAAAAPDAEVVDKPTRRRFSPSYKLRVVEEADRCNGAGRGRATPATRGLVLVAPDDMAQGGAEWVAESAVEETRSKAERTESAGGKVCKLERENTRLEKELEKARLIIDVQGKVAGLLGLSLEDGTNS